jgi:molybdopterin-guanine dinucleotide biosynthesis protein A
MSYKACSAVILAGGAGQRMGGNKPFYVHQGRPLLAAVIEALKSQTTRLSINCGSAGQPFAQQVADYGYPLIFDRPDLANLGPLTGVHSAIAAAVASGESVVVTAPCDMPFLPADMIDQLLLASTPDIDVVHFRGARDYPLCALWNVRQLPRLEAALTGARASGGLAVMQYLRTIAVKTVVAADDEAFANINTPAINDPKE